MGIVNITPDSFSDGGLYLDRHKAVDHALKLIDAGADMLDLGAESTRPGSLPVPAELQIKRLLPVLREIRRQSNIPISVDTASASVMQQVLAEGADLINDITALADEGAARLVAAAGAACCLMHMQGSPQIMQNNPSYVDVVDEVDLFLQHRQSWAIQNGIAPASICLDPGFGFGKSLEHNMNLLGRIKRWTKVAPVLVGISRKSMWDQLLKGRSLEERLPASLAAACWAAEQGVAIIRVHDVRATRDALAVWMQLRKETE